MMTTGRQREQNNGWGWAFALGTAVALIFVLRPVIGMLMQLAQIDNAESVNSDHNQFWSVNETYEITMGTGWTRHHKLQHGIEWITYTPTERRYETPLFFVHGMWHGAWCWQWWQEHFAEAGWQSHAISLPGHGLSPEQRPIPQCTLDYYTSFVRQAIASLDRSPVLFGHSMGGAIAQWYLKYVRDDLPAVVLVASWVAHAAMIDGIQRFLATDTLGVLQAWNTGDAAPYIRTPDIAARKLISADAIVSPEELHARLGNESIIVTAQHNPPFWEPPALVRAPMLYLAAEADAVISNSASRATAEHYGADFLVIPGAGHDIMLERSYGASAEKVQYWLDKVGVN